MATKATTSSPRKVSLTLANLGDLSSGQAAAVINAAIKAAIRDTEDRGSDKKKRKVTIVLEVGKVGDSVTATIEAKVAVPPYRTEPTVGSLRVGAAGEVSVEFNPLSPENPEQKTFVDGDE